MSYIENPKLAGSGIVACIPQTGTCPHKCADCFFQSGRSYLEPLEENLPNIPSKEEVGHRIVRVNDGNDSANKRDLVINATNQFPHRFFNTADPKNLDAFPGPVVLTANTGPITDLCGHMLPEIPDNLMFVRCRTNAWNLDVVREVVEYYTVESKKKVPVVLTFMAYFLEEVPKGYEEQYIVRTRTTNKYVAIKTAAWREIMAEFENNLFVSSCGKIEGEQGSTRCRYCGVCLREYFATLERMSASS